MGESEGGSQAGLRYHGQLIEKTASSSMGSVHLSLINLVAI